LEYVLKDVPRDFKKYEVMYKHLAGSKYIRTLDDTIPERSMFVFRFYPTHLLHLIQLRPDDATTKRILRDVLRGIAELHAKRFLHTGKQSPKFPKGQGVDKFSCGPLEQLLGESCWGCLITPGEIK
jgi:hypothetical protein